MAGTRVLLVCLAALAGAREAQAVTPIEKVVELLKKLSAQIAEEGKAEAAEYDKYSCFCKEQADEKLYAIEKSTEKIGELAAKETKLKADIAELDQAISDLTTKVDGLEKDVATEKDKRATALTAYEKAAKDLADAVSACERAIEAMKESKENIDGKVDLAQLSASSPLLAASLLAQMSAKQNPASYEYSSNDLIATLQDLRTRFVRNKAELDEAEISAKSASELKTQDMSNQKTFAEKDKSEKEQRSEELGEVLAETTQEMTEETKSKTADGEFMEVLTSECETKATEFDQRSKTRSEEITAITSALGDLQKNAVGNSKVNTKLNDLQVKSKVAAPSFLQLRGSPLRASLLAKATSSSRIAATQNVLDLLLKRTTNSNSPVLASISMKLTMLQQSGVDHFVKVRELIKDLLTKLAADAKSEADTKTYCDTNMKKQVTARDANMLTIEDKTGALTSKNAELDQVKHAISDLEGLIAENMKALNEALELRAEQKATNEMSISMSDEGKKSIEYALQVLTDFYSKALLQENKGSYTPPKSDRSGNTVGDMAPKVFSGEYHGNQDASKGIIGILEVLAADFGRTKAQVEKDEADSEKAYQELKTTTEADNVAKNKEVGEKKAKESTLKDEIIQLMDDKKEAQKMLEISLTTLEDLKKMCVAGEETYKERKEKREDEIDALKEAMSILENWKGF